MSTHRKRKKRDKERAPPPITAAGLMTFFNEDIGGFKVRPEFVLFMAFLLITAVIMAHLGLFAP